MTPTQRERDIKRQEETRLQKAMALELARNYCLTHNLSTEKLEKQRFALIYSEAIFAQPSDIVPNGLVNDLETQPKPTLILRAADGKIEIEQTEHTKKYLAQ